MVIEKEAVLAVAEEIFGQGGRFGGSTRDFGLEGGYFSGGRGDFGRGG